MYMQNFIKRLIALCASFIMMFAVCACSQHKTDNVSNAPEDQTSKTNSIDNRSDQASQTASISNDDTANNSNGYEQINADQAKKLMDTEQDYIILDVRTKQEFNESHIPGAILIPDYEIAMSAETKLTDKDKLILVYCRTGRRSKNAAAELSSLGYTNVKEFGGIIDWPYETVSE